MNKEELARALADSTSLVLNVRDGEKSLLEFIDTYNNFFYRYALDGHEAGAEERQMLIEQQRAIEFHRRIQADVLDPLYLAGTLDKESLKLAGRIDEEEAKLRLGKLCDEHDAEGILRELAT